MAEEQQEQQEEETGTPNPDRFGGYGDDLIVGGKLLSEANKKPEGNPSKIDELKQRMQAK